MADVFPNGLIFRKPREKAPSYVKGSLSIKVDEFIKTLKDNEIKGWVNIDLLENKNGKCYSKFNTYGLETTKEIMAEKNVDPEEEQIQILDIPF